MLVSEKLTASRYSGLWSGSVSARWEIAETSSVGYTATKADLCEADGEGGGTEEALSVCDSRIK